KHSAGNHSNQLKGPQNTPFVPGLQDRLDPRIDRDMGLWKTVDLINLAALVPEMEKPADVIVLIEDVECPLRVLTRKTHGRNREGPSEGSRHGQIFSYQLSQGHK